MNAKSLMIMIALLLPLLLVLVGPATAADVAQGRCVDFDTAKKRITLEEYSTGTSKEHPHGKPTGLVSVFDSAEAKIGIPPQRGDILRIAYTVEDGIKRAIKVMNVSRQDLRKK